MIERLENEIVKVRQHFGLSLAQFGSLVGAPATSVKRWEEGVKPQERFVFQIVLVLGLISDPEEVYYDLGRHGVQIDKRHWDGFAGLVKGAENSLVTAREADLPRPEVDGALVTGVKGLLGLIATTFAVKNSLGTKGFSAFAARIAELLR